MTYEIPNGFRGEVVAEYAVPDCPAVETRDGRLVVPIPEDGRGCVSDPFAESGSDVEVVRAGTSPPRPLLAGKAGPGGAYWGFQQKIETSEGGHTHRSETFFVGTAEEYASFRNQRPSHRQPALR